jgi:hypothetical protein
MQIHLQLENRDKSKRKNMTHDLEVMGHAPTTLEKRVGAAAFWPDLQLKSASVQLG